MTVDSILWPPTLAIVDPRRNQAFDMRFLKETPVKVSRGIEVLTVAQGLRALHHEFSSGLAEAHYLAYLHVRPLDGKRMPQGKVEIVLDGESVLEGSILNFLPDPEAFDCMKLRRWKKTEYCFLATKLINREAVPDEQIGFMAPNEAKLDVYLSGLVAEEPVTLEFEAVTALYTTESKP